MSGLQTNSKKIREAVSASFRLYLSNELKKQGKLHIEKERPGPYNIHNCNEYPSRKGGK